MRDSELRRMQQDIILLKQILGQDGQSQSPGGSGPAPVSAPAYGVYTPVLSGSVNLDGATAGEFRYVRNGDIVDVKGRLAVDPTANATPTSVSLSLPIPSTFTSVDDLTGAGAIETGQGGSSIKADTSNHVAKMDWTSTTTASTNMYVNWSYRVRSPGVIS